MSAYLCVWGNERPRWLKCVCVWPWECERRAASKLVFIKMCRLWRGTAAPASNLEEQRFNKEKMRETEGRQILLSALSPLPYIFFFPNDWLDCQLWRSNSKHEVVSDFLLQKFAGFEILTFDLSPHKQTPAVRQVDYELVICSIIILKFCHFPCHQEICPRSANRPRGEEERVSTEKVGYLWACVPGRPISQSGWSSLPIWKWHHLAPPPSISSSLKNACSTLLHSFSILDLWIMMVGWGAAEGGEMIKEGRGSTKRTIWGSWGFCSSLRF